MCPVSGTTSLGERPLEADFRLTTEPQIIEVGNSSPPSVSLGMMVEKPLLRFPLAFRMQQLYLSGCDTNGHRPGSQGTRA